MDGVRTSNLIPYGGYLLVLASDLLHRCQVFVILQTYRVILYENGGRG